MKKKKNRRTLKKRIRKVMSFSTFVTVVSLSGFFICMILYASKALAVYQAETICSKIQMEINSGIADGSLGIDNVEELQPDNKRTGAWISELAKHSLLYELAPFDVGESKICVEIKVNGKILYSNYDRDFNRWADFYSDTASEKIIINHEQNKQVGTVKVRVNPKVLVPLVTLFLIIIVIVSIVVLIIAKIFNMFLTIPIIKPLTQLEKKVKALAEGDDETALNTQLVLKRPLREIESLADSTNAIMNKLHGYNEILERQKEVLENQNSELEVQNDELVKSKHQIQEQQAQLIQSEKMASVGLLTAAITHEINTPIGAINSNVQISDMLLGELLKNPLVTSSDELSTLMAQLKEVNDINLIACGRIIEIIKSLKSFSRLDQSEFQEADINESIKSVLVLAHNLLKRRITVHTEYGDIPYVQCFAGQLNQVFMNIIVNASQAIEGDGEIFIKTWQDAGYLLVTIKDTGTGISPENMSKIFEPGFTTKGVGVGLGIGLYLCYSIIQNHKGEISVTSDLGKGTEFMIKIPIKHEL